MIGSEQLRATHLDLSELDWRYRELARSHDECLRRSTYAVLDQPSRLLKHRLQSWPTFVSRERLRDFERISVGIASLVRSIPRRIFDNDPVRIGEFYQLEEPQVAEVLLSEPSGFATALSRGDFIDTPNGMKCIEFNFTPTLGGWETAILQKIHLGIEPTARFIEEEGVEVSVTNTIATLFDYVLSQVVDQLGCRDEEVNTIFVLAAEDPLSTDPAGFLYIDSEYESACRRRGIAGRATACHYSNLKVRNGLPFLGDRRIHSVIELCKQITIPEIYRCFKAGTICLFNGPVMALMTTKQNIALLSEQADSGRYSAEERELIERHVPWTRRVRPGYVSYQGEREYLPGLLISQREHLVLKDALECGGKGVALGRSTPPEVWERYAEDALDRGGWVVQEVLESRPYLYQCGEYGCAPHDVIWGPFVFGDRYAGAILRMQPQADRRAVNLSLSATEGLVFEI